MIVNEVYFEKINQIFDDIHNTLEDISGSGKKLKIFTRKTLEALLAHKDFFTNYVSCLEKLAENPNSEKMFTTFYDRYTKEIANIFQQGIESGEFAPVDVTGMSRAAYCMLTGTIFLRFSMKVDFDLSDQNDKQLAWLIQSVIKH